MTKHKENESVPLRVRPLVEAVVRRPAVVMLAALVLVGGGLALVFELSGSSDPRDGDPSAFQLPREFELPDSVAKLPEDYSKVQPEPPEKRAPPKPVVQPKPAPKAPDPTAKALAELTAKLNKLTGESQSRLSDMDRKLENKLGALTGNMDRMTDQLRRETQQVLERLNQRQRQPAAPPKPPTPPVDEEMLAAVNESAILFPVGGQARDSGDERSGAAVNGRGRGESVEAKTPNNARRSNKQAADEEAEFDGPVRLFPPTSSRPSIRRCPER